MYSLIPNITLGHYELKLVHTGLRSEILLERAREVYREYFPREDLWS